MSNHAKEPAGSDRRQSEKLVRSQLTLLITTVLTALLLATAAALAPAAEPEPAYLGAFGPDGTSASDFERVGSVAADQETGYVYVADTVKGALYKFDEDGQPVDFGGSEPYISENELSGLVFNTLNGKSQVAVDSDSHVIYVTSSNAVRAFEEDGNPHVFPAGPNLGTNEISGATELTGLAVDSEGNIYASDFAGEKIRIYSSSGEPLTEIEMSEGIDPANLAVAPTGDLLIVDGGNNIGRRLIPSAYPVTGSTTYSLEPGTLESGFTISVAVDPITGFIYLGQFDIASEGRVAVLKEKGEFIGTLGAEGQEGHIDGRALGLAINGLKRAYIAVQTESTSPEQAKVRKFEPFKFFVGPPTVTATSATGLSTTSAALRARINPNTLATTYWFEYGTENCDAAPGTCTMVPIGGKGIGSGHEPVSVVQAVSGLQADTTYHYRVVAENAFPGEGTTKGPLRTFTTQSSSFDFGLIDGRVWEQVTPIDKFGGGVTNGALVQAAADGSGVTFPTRGSIVEEPEGSRALEVSAVLARRTGSTWSVDDLVPQYTKATGAGLGPEYKVFSPDLGRAVMEPRDETPLSPEASERTPYLRENSTPPAFRPLVTAKEPFANVEPGTVFGGEINGAKNPVALSGANAELTDIVVSSEAPLIAGAQKRALYLWKDGDLSPVSELPPAEQPTGEEGRAVFAQLGSGVISVRHAVSSDGSRVFWSPNEPVSDFFNLDALYLRDVKEEETVRIDVPEEGVTGLGTVRPAFAGASADGSVVYFTDTQQLTSDANSEGRDLYRCEIDDVGGSLGCAELLDLSASAIGANSAEVEGLPYGLSEDGDKAYFVATGVLTNGPNQAGDTAQPEARNLYLWEEGSGLRFIAALSQNDTGQIGGFRQSRTSSFSSPSGRYLTFMSERNLAGDESDDPGTGEPTEQVFLYDSATERLRCVSCNPNGGTDAAHQIKKATSEGGLVFPDLQQLWQGQYVSATLPEATEGEPTLGYSFYQPRAVLDNGRVFFNSVAPLVSGDSNGTWDVYLYEPLGVGTCSPSSGSGSIARSGDGCIGLISSGKDKEPSVFVDASTSGDDLFFMTLDGLSVLDDDGMVDLYDARVDGVAAVATRSTECLGEACQPAAQVPNDPTPASAAFKGAGNAKPSARKRCAKGKRKVRSRGKVRCVKRKGRKGSHGRRAGR